MPNSDPYSAIDIPEVMSRNQAARDIVSGFATATPTLAVTMAAHRHRSHRCSGLGHRGDPAVR